MRGSRGLMKIDFWKIVIVCGLKPADYLSHVKKSGKAAVLGDVWLLRV
jgi:hypothetical protein